MINRSLLPKEAIKRANVRFAIEYFGTKVAGSFHKYAFNDKNEGALETYKADVNAALVRVSTLSHFFFFFFTFCKAHTHCMNVFSSLNF